MGSDCTKFLSKNDIRKRLEKLYFEDKYEHLNALTSVVEKRTKLKIEYISTPNFHSSNWSVDGDVINVYYARNIDDPFLERLSITRVLSTIIFEYIFKLNNVSKNEIIYFSQKILELYSKMDNGALLRSKYALECFDIHSEVKKYCKDYDYPNNKSDLDILFNGIFLNVEKNVTPLRCTMKIAEEYAQSKKSNDFPKGFKIGCKEYCINNKIFGKTFPHKSGVDIWYSSTENLESALKSVNSTQIMQVKRLIVAHELGHAILHSMPANSQLVRPNAELEAAYFARLLLEACEKSYNNDQVDETYKEACENWKSLFRKIYSKWENKLSKDEIESIFNDDEWDNGNLPDSSEFGKKLVANNL